MKIILRPINIGLGQSCFSVMFVRHNSSLEQSQTNKHVDLPLLCPECGKSLETKRQMYQYIEIQNVGAFFCDECDEKFQTKRLFEYHK